MPTPLSAVIPLMQAAPLSIYVAQSDLPDRLAQTPALSFELNGHDLWVFWPAHPIPFSIPLAPSDLAATVAGKSLWEEVDEEGNVRHSEPVVVKGAGGGR